MSVGLTPSQTVGPYFTLALTWGERGPCAVDARDPEAIRIEGRLLDGAGEPVPDGLIESWQSTPARSERFSGFARCATDDEGRWQIVTLAPGERDDGQAPHLALNVLARGLLHRVTTRIYLPEHAAASDPLLASVPPGRRETLIAKADGERRYSFDIVLQGPGETVFLEL